MFDIDTPVILHHVDGFDTTITLRELFDANEFDPAEEQEIANALAAGQPYYGGGGAAAEWGVEPMRESFDSELDEIKRRAGVNEEMMGLPPGAEMIYKRVMDALQDAEEMGGVGSTREYAALMDAISQECQQRKATAVGAHGMDAEF